MPIPAVSSKLQSRNYIETIPCDFQDVTSLGQFSTFHRHYNNMRSITFASVLLGAFVASTHADCRHPNGNIQTDAYHAPCSEALGNPLNTMCCAIDRPNPSGGYSADGLAADLCLPNGLCQQKWTPDENSTTRIEYYREECTVEGWKNGSCLSVCLSNSVSVARTGI